MRIGFVVACLVLATRVWGETAFTHVATHEMQTGTHRPELISLPDGSLLAVVVHPTGNAVGARKHEACRYDRAWKPVGKSFAVTTITEEYGEPADHRALRVGEEIVVVYQSLRWKGSPPRGGGPMEQYARDQSLMLARFRLDGRETFRGPIVAHAETGGGENFPDFCIAWKGDRFLVCTGTGARKVKLREVSLRGEVLSTHELPVDEEGVPEELGNSLLVEKDRVTIVSGGQPGRVGSLTLCRLDAMYRIADRVAQPRRGREETFPTGVLACDEGTILGFIVRAPGAGGGPEENPYDPRVDLLDAKGGVLEELEVGSGGFLHVHLGLALSGDRLWVAWSRRATGPHGEAMPQVVVEEYRRNRARK